MNRPNGVSPSVRTRTPRGLALAAALLIAIPLVGCASGSGGSSSGSASSGSRNTISRAQLAELEPTATAYDAVRRLHPSWLQGRGSGSFQLSSTVLVHLNGARIGGPGELARLMAGDVEKMEFLSGNDATQKFGTHYEKGVILVTGRASG